MGPLMRAQVNDWHVYVPEIGGGEWLTVAYDGYAPVDVWVGDRLMHTTYRHMARGCTRAVCQGVHADMHAQYGAARH